MHVCGKMKIVIFSECELVKLGGADVKPSEFRADKRKNLFLSLLGPGLCAF